MRDVRCPTARPWPSVRADPVVVPAPTSSRALPLVAVCGDGSPVAPSSLAAASELGALLARAGFVVVTGMPCEVSDAAARGAFLAGGLTVGVLPGLDRSDASPWVALPLALGAGPAASALLAQVAEVVVTVGGGWSTVATVSSALAVGRPVVAVDAWPLPGGPAAVVPAGGAREAFTLVCTALGLADLVDVVLPPDPDAGPGEEAPVGPDASAPAPAGPDAGGAPPPAPGPLSPFDALPVVVPGSPDPDVPDPVAFPPAAAWDSLPPLPPAPGGPAHDLPHAGEEAL